MMPFPDKKYAVIYADPPWNTNYVTRDKNGIQSKKVPYNTMDDEDIINMPVKNISEENAILFLWCIDAKIPIIEKLMKAWGFQYRTIAFIWHKVYTTNHSNTGILAHYTKKSCEVCYIGIKGKSIVKYHTLPQFIESKPGRHSEKPSIIRTYIKKMTENASSIELFSRTRIEGWDCWGDQVPNFKQTIIKEVLL